MQAEPPALRVADPGVRALFAEASRFRSWLDVEAAPAQAQADLDAIRAGLAPTGHPLLPLIWELDRVCEGDAGGYVHQGATTQNITQTGSS